MERILEPELMVSPEQVESWDSSERTFIIDSFVYWFKYRNDKTGTIVDLGCGSGKLAVAMLKEFPDLKVLGIDGSQKMIELAQKNLENANLTESVKLQNAMIQDVGPIPNVKTVISLGVLHHFENPNEFWESIIRITDGNPSVAMILDLVRPEEEWVIDELEALFKDTHPELYVQDTLNSLRAAFTEEEVRNQLSQLELNHDIKVHINPATGAELMLIQVKLNQ